MKQSEAIRIPSLLAARWPAPVVEEAVIDGIRMLVILGSEVDTVIEYIRGGGAKMPQLSSYDEVAEDAARADVLLAKQRASGRRNTTGEGVDWPFDWKLARAKAAGKIWYAAPGSGRGPHQKPAAISPLRPEEVRRDGAPSARSWRDCADYYLRGLWFPQDRQLIAKFSGAIISCDAVDELCRTYQVHRNFEGCGAQRYQAFANFLNTLRLTRITRDNLVLIVNQGIIALGEAYGKNLISAVTKALWMIQQHPVAIYDRKARNGLSACGLLSGEGDYRIYCDSWFVFYDRPDTQSGIDDAVSWLSGSRCAQEILGSGKLQISEFEQFTKSEMLRNRIADMRLASLGGAQDFFG